MAFGVNPTTRAGRAALEIYAEVLEAVRADKLVGAAVRRAGDILFVQDQPFDLQHFERVFVCGAGKASAEMAGPICELLGSRLSGGLIVIKSHPETESPGITMVRGSHPMPGTNSIAAGEAMLEFAQRTTERDLVIFCLSGGASAMMEALLPGIELNDLRTTTDALLRSGADIRTLNAVRIKLSRIKGGGLARAFKAQVIVLVLSDVIGNDLSVIGSGPFFAPRRREHRAHAVAYGVPGQVSPAVQAALTRQSDHETHPVTHAVIGSAAMMWPIAADAARWLGFDPFGYADPMKGEARLMSDRIMRLAKAKITRGETEFCMVLVGETTVTVRGDGLGGRCQEMAARAAIGVEAEKGLAFLAAGTDGNDGPTDAAGGIVEQNSVSTAQEKGIGVRAAVQLNDSYRFLEAAGGLIRTGPTGSNVNDICLVVHAPD